MVINTLHGYDNGVTAEVVIELPGDRRIHTRVPHQRDEGEAVLIERLRCILQEAVDGLEGGDAQVNNY